MCWDLNKHPLPISVVLSSGHLSQTLRFTKVRPCYIRGRSAKSLEEGALAVLTVRNQILEKEFAEVDAVVGACSFRPTTVLVM